jgi:glycosyltransferase involved in cell wall biosynthesis
VSSALRVFVVVPDGTPTAAHRSTVEILSHLPPHNVEPVVCFLGDGPLCAVCRDDLGVETILVPTAGRSGSRGAVELVMRGARAGLVHSVSAGAHLVAGRAARRLGLRTVWSQFDVPAFATLRALRAALTPARAVLAASALIEERQHRFNPRRTPIALVPPGVQRSGVPGGRHRERARAALGIGPEELVIGWLAGRDPSAEREVALRAVASVCHARPQARLIVVPTPGSPLNRGLEESLRPLASSLGIAPRLSVAPPHEGSGPPPVLAALDVALYPQAGTDPVGLGPIEAQAAGVPVVAADREPIREWVAHERTGLLVPPGDHEAFALALLALADDFDRRAQYAVDAWEAALRRHDGAAVATQVAAIYRKAAEA